MRKQKLRIIKYLHETLEASKLLSQDTADPKAQALQFVKVTSYDFDWVDFK